MLELPLIFLSGMAGSAHCLGMCGGFVLAIGSRTRGLGQALWWQVSYTAGRVLTYAALGAAAGSAGWQLRGHLDRWPIAGILAVLAGGLLLYQGLRSTGLVCGRGVAARQGPCLAGSLFAGVLRLPGSQGAFLAGLFTGFLPCGLLYGMLALAAATGHLWQGLATMAVFGLGTAPALVLLGAGGSLAAWPTRQRLDGLAAWCLLAAGAVTCLRGAAALAWSATATAACPFCPQ